MTTNAPLSPSQYGIYVECVQQQDIACYNLPYLYELGANIDGERLCQAVESVFKAHPTLFTRIGLDDNGEPVQTIQMEQETWSLSVEEVNDIEAVKQQLVEPFHIQGDRLFRVRVFHTATHYYLFLDVHHIIFDGTSLKIFIDEVLAAYRGEEIQPEQQTLAASAAAEQEARQTPVFDEHKQWYAAHFDCGDTYTPLTPDLEPSAHTEGCLQHTLSISLSEVDTFCRQNGIFRSTLFTCAYAYLMAKYNNEQESLFQTIYNGRQDKSLSHTVGMFVKTLPFYLKFDAETSVLDYLKDGQQLMGGCREHGLYAYSDIVHDLQLQCHTAFAWHAEIFADNELEGQPVRFSQVGNETTGVPLYAKVFIHDGRLQIDAEYASNEYSEVFIANLLESYDRVLGQMLTCEKLRDIELVTTRQTQALDDFNQTDSPYDDSQTVVSLFKRCAAAAPDSIAVVYQDKSYTYAQVDDLSDRIAAYLAAKGCGAEDVVSILIPRCEWMAIASLGVLKAGCAYQPLDHTYPKERLDFMMQDASVKMLIVDADLFHLVEDYQGEVIFTRDLPDLPAAEQLPEGPHPHSLFSLIYTSGSTGVPKGCQIEQYNVVAFCHMHQHVQQISAESRIAVYASFGFDASLMEIYSALTIGAQFYIIPEEVRLDLVALNEFFEKYGITHVFMTTQVAYQFATNFENHSLQKLLTGGEKLPTLVPPASYVVANGYGPSETICYVTSFDVTKQHHNVPIGKAQRNLKCYIVDKHGHRLPVGAAGELWVAGPQVTRGYLNRPEKTAEVYIDNPFCRDEKYRRIYCTGDIVRYLPSGDIEFVGRRDGQVKIRGFRIELKEVEAVVREFPGIKDATVQAFDAEGGGKFIAAYVVSDEPVDIEALNNFILDQKPPYMVPAVTMQIETIPLNQNQKVNKRALPKPERKAVAQEEQHVPMNVLEKQLHSMVSDIVGHQDFGVTTILGYAGLTSITAIRLAVLMSKRFGVTLDAKALVKTGTLQSIENLILEQLLTQDTASQTSTATPAAETRRMVPLSHAQTGVYFECLKNPASTVYNIPCLFTFPAGTDASQLADIVRRVAESHTELGVHFTTVEGVIMQTLEDSVPVEVPVSEMTDEELSSYKHEFVQPFKLQQAPLYRFQVVTTPQGVHLLMDVHHLVFDGGSSDLFIRQVCEALDGAPVEKEAYSYLDFVADQQQAEQAETFQAAKQFFAEQLQTCEGASEIPADLPATGQTGLIGEALSMPDYDQAAVFCRQQGITPAHLFLGATAYVISRYINNREVYLCTVSNGRANLKTAETVGMFVNTLALGLHMDDVTIGTYLQQTSKTFEATLQHEDYPFATIATDFGYHPAIAYAYQLGVMSDYQVGGQPVQQELLELNVPKFKINIVIESRGVVVEYDDAVYTQELAQGLADSIVAVATRMMTVPQEKLRQLSIVSDSQEAALSQLRQTETGDAPFKLFHECISHFAKTQPTREALVAIDGSYTYQQMDEVTSTIAAALREKGVRERDRVALLLPRTSRLILALFGVLKAGAAYIPCDPEYPADRIKLILEDSEARYIITTADRLDSVPADKAIDVETLLASSISCDTIAADITGDDLAYLIYTSGSTGRPKGVMLRHEGICNYLYGHPANVLAHGVQTDVERMLSVTTISFDAALQDIGIAPFNGKTLVIATEEQANNPLELAQLINSQHIDMVSGTPSRWQTWLTSDDFCQAISKVKICRAGGEKFSDQLLDQLRSVTKARIFNCYGPTETTVASNNKELTEAKFVTVGKPQLNVKEFIVDSDGNELPVGVVGELYIGGRGVARGYNNLDEMTRERFVDYHGTRVYKSGDYAKWLRDGDVIILGRTDHQIKLRGLRIELGEIENVMLRVEGMKKVVIMIRKLNDKEHLCAYYTADRAIAPEDLKAEISKSLTQYMVPTAYLQLMAMPMTPNGKTDVKALPEPQLAVSAAYTEPVNDTERTFCKIFADILQMDKVGATDNFFELGGTSLVVTRVIIEADKAGMHVAYGDVFAHPTPRQLARLITGEDVGKKGGETVDKTGGNDDGFDYTAIDLLLQKNTLDHFRKGERQTLGNVLLTGATGYLGIHILHWLIDSDAQHIYCLVRGKSQEAAESRLRTLLYYYFANSYKSLFGERLHVVLGDVTSDIDEGLQVDTVFNCAAVVKHFSEGTEIEDVNIGGAKRCVNFCLKTGARLIHISTASTRGLWTEEMIDKKAQANLPLDVFTEQRLFIGQYLGNKYIWSKYMGERLILDAVASHGLSAKIMRVGNLAARSTDGEFQANFSTNSFMGRIKVYNMLGCCPYEMRNKTVEFSPINEVSQAIVLLASTPKSCTVFHPYNIHGQFLGDVLTGLSKVADGVRFVEQEEFAQAMEAAKNDPQKARQMASLLAYQDVAHGQKVVDVDRNNDFTTQVLYRLDFSWSPTSWDYVEQMLKAIGGFGFFE